MVSVWLCCDLKDQVARPLGRVDAVQTAQVMRQISSGPIAGVQPLIWLLIAPDTAHVAGMRQNSGADCEGDVCQFHL